MCDARDNSGHLWEVRVKPEPEWNLLKEDVSRPLLAPYFLAVVLFAGDVAGCAILRSMQFRPFLFVITPSDLAWPSILLMRPCWLSNDTAVC
jgi:hypothetical protein